MRRLGLIAFAMTLSSLAPLFGQTFGEFQGTVADPSGAVIAGAKVSVTNTSTGATREVETNASGSYNVPFLNPGVYNITAELEGFSTAQVSNRILEVGDVQEVNLTLTIGAVTEVIEVQAGAQMLDTSDTAIGTVIDQERIVELPINGRNYLNLVKLSPNVAAEQPAGGQANSRQGGERANQSISIAGQRMQYNRYTLDGVENTDPNFNTFVVRPSVDALQEFKVQTGVYSAQFGSAARSATSVSTKSATNSRAACCSSTRAARRCRARCPTPAMRSPPACWAGWTKRPARWVSPTSNSGRSTPTSTPKTPGA